MFANLHYLAFDPVALEEALHAAAATSRRRVSMEYEQLIQAAREAIGEGEKDDYIIAPTKHAGQLAAKAPALSSLLRRSELSTITRQYEERDREAGEAQLIFKKTASRANWGVFLTACFSALLLMTSPLAGPSTDGWAKWAQILLGVCGILSGAFASMWLLWIREGNLLEHWMTARAGVETRRTQYFELVTGMGSDTLTSDIPLPLLQLEYFRRYQLDIQRAYYDRRGADHRRAADRMLRISGAALGLASLATGIGGLLAGALGPQWVSVAGLGAAATALSAFASAEEATDQDRPNMERYKRTLEVLESLSGKLDDVRMAAAIGDRESLRQFVTAVHEQLSLEHRQWLETSESIAASLTKLNDALAMAKSKLPKADSEE